MAKPGEEKFLILDTTHIGDFLMWWRPDGHGYTVCVDDAGRYTREQVKSRCDRKNHVPIPEHVALGLSRRVVGTEWTCSITSVDHLAASNTPKWLVRDLVKLANTPDQSSEE